MRGRGLGTRLSVNLPVEGLARVMVRVLVNVWAGVGGVKGTERGREQLSHCQQLQWQLQHSADPPPVQHSRQC